MISAALHGVQTVQKSLHLPYNRTDSTKSPASVAGNIIVSRLMSGEYAKSSVRRSAGFHSVS
jgi:hypothetical protein